ncbi:MAG: winged helix DNA-binding domain-containing protein [Nocardiaceae bacterium]|nr:winged helix DNA-binding domain-containing protein [Nocardiaceae bacterium]
MDSLSRSQARRIALAAQGLLDKPHDPPTMRTLVRAVERTGVLQIDSVNVLQRAHYMPLFSRMGPYDVDLLHRATGRSPHRLVEYWAHVAAYMPVDLWPYMRHRMTTYYEQGHVWTGEKASEDLVQSLMSEIRDGGAKTARELDSGLPRAKKHWGWNWSESKRALEWLFISGQLAVSRRNSQFERVYDLPERVIPRDVLDQPEPTAADARRELVRRAATSLGVATVGDLADYYRMRKAEAQPAIDQLAEEGELLPVSVDGVGHYLHRDARVPRKVSARVLLSPFDPLVWERARTERLFDFSYRIEIYTPEHKRIHGYYVLPFLLGEAMVARVDLKADRAGSKLLVKGAFAEPGSPPETAAELGLELRRMANWLGLEDLVVEPRGDLAPELQRSVHE